MEEIRLSQIAIRVNKLEKEKFFLLSALEKKPLSRIIKDLVDKELSNRKFKASEIRKLHKELRAAVLAKMSEVAIPVYNQFKDELLIDETGDGIE